MFSVGRGPDDGKLETGKWKLAESPFFELYKLTKSLQRPLDAFKYNETVKKNKASFGWSSKLCGILTNPGLTPHSLAQW